MNPITINAAGINVTSGSDSRLAVTARGASNKNGSAKTLKRLGWYWLRPVQAYATEKQPLADSIAETVKELRAAGFIVEIVGENEQ